MAMAFHFQVWRGNRKINLQVNASAPGGATLADVAASIRAAAARGVSFNGPVTADTVITLMDMLPPIGARCEKADFPIDHRFQSDVDVINVWMLMRNPPKPRAKAKGAAGASGRLAGPSAAGSAAGSASAAAASTDEVSVWASAPEKSNGKVKKAVQFGNQIQIHYDDETTARKEFKSIVKEHGLKLHMDMEEAKKRMERLRREMAVLKGYTGEVGEESESDIEFQEEEESSEEEQDDIDESVTVDATEEEEDAKSIENALTAIADAAEDLKKYKK
jgi:hypothetical protein